jgi:hypothetical protein
MTDSEKIIAALEGKVSTPDKAAALAELFQEIATAYEKGAANGVALALQRRLKPLNSSFETAFSKLHKKMGL